MSQTKPNIRAEIATDIQPIRDIHMAAFADDSIGDLADDLRRQDTPLTTISLVACDGTAPVGHVMLSHALLDGPTRLIDVMVLSPLGVLPSHQRRGIGTALIKAAIHAADDAGAPLLFLEGSPAFYGARGFEAATALGFRRPSLRIPEKAFQVAKLSAYLDGMDGTFVYRDVHWRHGVGLYRS